MCFIYIRLYRHNYKTVNVYMLMYVYIGRVYRVYIGIAYIDIYKGDGGIWLYMCVIYR